MNRLPGLLVVIALAGSGMPAHAQTSAGFRLEEHTFGAGGVTLMSTDYRITGGSLGEAVMASPMSGPDYSVMSGFMAAYPPPGEVGELVFTDAQTLQWAVEPSAGTYNLYREALGSLSGSNGGSCAQQAIPGNSTTEGAAPPAGEGWFYLVTVENRLGEEGTRGSDGDGYERPETGICP